MFDRIAQASEALRGQAPSLFPAMKGCVACGSVRQIAAPVLGSCTDCGVDYIVFARLRPER